MGRSGGTKIFEAVVQSLHEGGHHGLSNAAAYCVVKALIRTLTEQGWDGHEEALGMVAPAPGGYGVMAREGVLRAFNELGYVADDQYFESGISTVSVHCSECGREIQLFRLPGEHPVHLRHLDEVGMRECPRSGAPYVPGARTE